jgi:hypothetical protein
MRSSTSPRNSAERGAADTSSARMPWTPRQPDIAFRVDKRRPLRLRLRGQIHIDHGDLHDSVVIVGMQAGGLHVDHGEPTWQG